MALYPPQKRARKSPTRRRQADQDFIEQLLADLRTALERAADLGLDFGVEERTPPAAASEEQKSPGRRVVTISIESLAAKADRAVFTDDLAALQCLRQALRPARRGNSKR